VQALQESDLQLRRVILSDLGAIGYLPAAEAIASAATENSFKLIALKGLLEQVQTGNASSVDPEDPRSLSRDAIRVMTLMDALL
jgi:phycocyanobilin lyase alpha subunit